MGSEAASYELRGTTVANGAGTATLTLQAPNVGPRGLLVVSIALLVTPSPPIPKCIAYKNIIAAQQILASKTAGDRGTFVGQEDVLFMGEQLILQWTGAAAAASCTAVLRGRANV